jgi:glycosyltransferase involved in cell wall biosynthesis
VNVVLVGNYLADRQQSMARFAQCLDTELNSRTIPARTIVPPARIAANRTVQGGLGKWLAYVDKFLLFPRTLRRLAKTSTADTLFHICDHSNAMYARELPPDRHLVTCHDLLAVRGAFGDPEAYCPASPTGKLLQKWILNSLASSEHVVCVSNSTANDFRTLAPEFRGTLDVVHLGQNTPYRVLPADEAWPRLANLPLQRDTPFILNVGSSLPRKNRDGCLRIFKKLADRFPGPLVFAGKELSAPQKQLAVSLGVADRVIELENISNEVLEALYGVAHALLFPSKAEGFGWPVLEAQVCGCPVVCSDRTSIPEVAGGAAFVHDIADETSFSESLLKLLDPALREDLRDRGLGNAAKLTTDRMIDGHVDIYRRILAAR